MTDRTTWKRLATIFAVSLEYKTCTDHPDPLPNCPYCRDDAAVQLYRAKLAGRIDATWQEVTTKLARRFQHFEECNAHTADSPDLENCPFCRDEDNWRRYVQFCGRQGVQPVRRDAEVFAEGAVAVSIYDIRAQHNPREDNDGKGHGT